MEKSMPGFDSLTISTAQSMIVSVFRPRKSNLTRPTASTSSLSSCVTTLVPPSSQYSGAKSVNGPGEMTTPPACFPAFRTRPSSDFARSMIAATSSSSRYMLASSAESSSAFSSVMPISNGTCFAIRSTNPYGWPSTRPVSRMTAFAAIVPKVMICDTRSRP